MATRRGRPRDEAARARVLDAATALFTERGYLATTVGEIAAAAGVAVQTIYSGYGSKVGVLAACHDVALAGDDEPTPLAERDWFRGLSTHATAVEAWRAALAAMHGSTARVAPVYAAMLAAEADPDVARLMRTLREQRARFSGLLVDRIADRPGGEAVDRARLADVVYATECVETYTMLVTQRGWPLERWRDWVDAVVTRELDPAAARG